MKQPGKPLRYKFQTPKRALDGHYRLGLHVPEFAETVGHIVTEWAILEEAMIIVMAALLGSGPIKYLADQMIG